MRDGACDGTATVPDVVVEGVRVRFERHVVLDDVSLRVPAGSTTVILGPSGVGKTTLLRAVLGLVEPDAGEVVIGGRSMTHARTRERAQIRDGHGVLLGGSSLYDASLFGAMTAWENVRYPLEVADVAADDVTERAWARMVEFELTDVADLRPDQLSGGLKRRVALARALVDDPSLIVLDDPGLAIDIVNRDKITESILRARTTTDATMIVACHDIALARALADEVVVILGGRVRARGPASDLLAGIRDADDLDERFGFRDGFSDGDDDSRALLAAERSSSARRQLLAYALVIAVGLVAAVLWASGIFFYQSTGTPAPPRPAVTAP